MTYSRHLKPSRLKLGWQFISFVSGLLLFGWLWQTSINSRWRGNDDFSWVEQSGDKIIIHTLFPEYLKLVTWKIPGNTLVTTAFGYGSYQWKNVFTLAEIDHRGGLVLTRTTQATLGLTIDGWQVGRRTNLSWRDKLKWWYWTRFKLRQQLTVDLSQSPAWQSGLLADGSPVFTPVEYQLDQLINQETFSQKIDSEGLSVSLINDNRWGRVLTNHGLELVSASQGQATDEQTIIWLKDEAAGKSQTVAWLKRLLPQAQIKVDMPEGFLSPIVIILGKDYN